jgi:hypothetical protein
VEFDHSGIYTGMVPGMAFPGMGRNEIPLEFCWNSVCLFVTHSLFIYTNKCLFGNQTQPLSSSHHQPCSSPPLPFVTATHIRRPHPRLPQQDSAMSPSERVPAIDVTKGWGFQVPCRREQRGNEQRMATMLLFVVLHKEIN